MPTKPVFQEKHVTLYNADVIDMLDTIDPDDFAVMLTDPPYGISYRSNQTRKTMARSIEGDEDTSLRDRVLDWWGDRPALVFGTWKKPFPENIRQLLIWDTKGALGMGAIDLPWKPSHQQIYVLGKGFAGRRTSDVLQFAPVQSMAKNGRVHPHEKPVDLLVELLRKCPDGPVFDPFAGSGSTLVAAKQLGREAVGIEIDSRYVQPIINRFSQQTFEMFDEPAVQAQQEGLL